MHTTQLGSPCSLPIESGDAILYKLQHINILNSTDSHTRKPINTDTNQISIIAFPDLALRSSWTVTHELSSYHQPNIAAHSLHKILKNPPKRTYTNHKLADWESFILNVDNNLAVLNIKKTTLTLTPP